MFLRTLGHHDRLDFALLLDPPPPPYLPSLLQNSCTCDQVILRSAYNSFDSAWSSNVVAMLVGSFVM